VHRKPSRAASFLLTGLLCLAGCAGRVPVTQFTNPKFDFSFVERVAVVPFENLSNDRQAGLRATRLMITELLASGAVDVVEPGEVETALAELQVGQPGRSAQPSTEQILSLGRTLGVQAVIVGTVTQSEVLRSGAVSVPAVTLDAHMVETETGTTVWAATQSEKGGTAGARILGTGGKPISETTRRCVQRLIETLVE
jgi:TolB-like protein